MDAVRNVFGQVLHRRLASTLNDADAERLRSELPMPWSTVEHWNRCGQSCQCCRYAAGDLLGTCGACDAAVQSLRTACTIASFVRESQSKREVISLLTGRFGLSHGPLPDSVMEDIGAMLPEIHGIIAPAGLAAVGLLCGGSWRQRA